MEKMELKDTIEMMVSDDYKERFKAEYYQTKIRIEKLTSMIKKYRDGELDFQPTCPIEVFENQVRLMNDYLNILMFRAVVEDVDIEIGD